MKEEKDIYPKNVRLIAKEFMSILEKYYPELVNRNYDSCGYLDRLGSPALDRMEFCVYIELMKAGAFNNEIKFDPGTRR